MSDYQGQRSQRLTSQFSTPQAKFDDLQKTDGCYHVQLQGKLDNEMATALSATLSLARLLNGKFDPNQSPAKMASNLQKLQFNWTEIRNTAKECYDEVSSYSVKIVQFHDSELGGWKARLDTLQGELEAKLLSTQNALHTSKSTLRGLLEQRVAAAESVSTLQRKLDKQ